MPVFALNASRTFWKASCSLPPQSDMTVIVVPGATVDDDGAAGLHAAATMIVASAMTAAGRKDRNNAIPPPLRVRKDVSPERDSSGWPRLGLAPTPVNARVAARAQAL